jgi:hypothetical protein
MQPLTKTSQPTTPTTGRSAHLMISSKISKSTSTSKPPSPHDRRVNSNISRSISEPRSLYGLDSRTSLFEPHQLELTNGVEGVRRPRSFTTIGGVSPLTAIGGGFGGVDERVGRLGRSASVGTGLRGVVSEGGDVTRLDLGLSDLLGSGSTSVRGRAKGRGKSRGRRPSVNTGRNRSG